MTQNTSVLELINARVKDNSAVGQRGDGYKLGLVIEGGGMRGVVAGGMISALEVLQLTPVFDAVYGTSAGAIVGAYLVAGQARLGTTIFYDNINNANFINLRNVIGKKPVLSLEYLLDHVCINEKILDTSRVLTGPLPLVAIATSLNDVEAHGLTGFDNERELFAALRGSARIPWVAGEPVSLRGDKYVDGSVAEPVPYRTARKDGCTHVLVLLTRPTGQLEQPAGKIERTLTAKWLDTRRLGLGMQYLRQNDCYVADIARLKSPDEMREDGLDALSVQIGAAMPLVNSLEKRRDVLVAGAKAGFQAVYQALNRKIPNVVELLHSH